MSKDIEREGQILGDEKVVGSHLESATANAPILEDDHSHHKQDAALDILGGGRVNMTDEQSRYICRKIDLRVLPVLCWVYFLQILDKNVVGYGANFGLITDTGMAGTQYSLFSSSGYWAQLALCLGPTMVLIVKVPTNILMSTCVFCWGASMFGLAFGMTFGPMTASRFLLGLFEAVNIPLFTVITATWYRRREQPLRIACWYGTNGVSAVLGSLLTWGLSFINGSLKVWQILFLLVGCVTVITAPFIYFFLDNNPAEARFLTPEERTWAVERLRSNNTGVENKEIKWNQVLECFTSPAVLVYVAIVFCINTGAAVTGTFGPLIIKGFGFDARQTILLNMPFGVVQMLVCLGACWAAAKWHRKGPILIGIFVPCLIGSGLLYGLGRGDPSLQGPLLFGYYCLAFLFGGNPLLFSWVASNTGGHTKKSLAISLCNAGSAIGNMVGPLLFNSNDAPGYKPGLAGVLGLFVAAMVLAFLLIFIIHLFNRGHEKRRVAVGKPAKLVNSSMDDKYQNDVDANQQGEGGVQLGQQAFADMTDRQNDEFIYSY